MKPAAIGFRVHSGWTSLIAVALEDRKPVVLARQRPHLVINFTYTFRQPYHTAEKMQIDEATAFLHDRREEARRLASAAIQAAQADVCQQGYEITGAALLLASGHPLPELSKILASHSLIHTADGELFREALLHACAGCKLRLLQIKEKTLLSTSAAQFCRKPRTLLADLTKLGKPLGSPWYQDEKFATLAAWLVLESAKT